MSSQEKRKSGISAFISYRRSTGREYARNIYERLSMNGINTFFDYNSMRNGKFNDQIYDAIEQADDFILVMSEDALQRCVNEDDWVRIEIEHALKHHKNIILVNTESDLVFPKNLPPSLSELPKYHAMTLNQEYYDESIARLIGMLSANRQKGNPHQTRRWDWFKRHKIAWIIGITLLTGGLITAFLLLRPHKRNASSSGIIAKLYLPRYADLDREVLDSPWFSDQELNSFEYVDTIISDQYSILPHSLFFTDEVDNWVAVNTDKKTFYHNLPLRLSIHNTRSYTQTVNEASLEILEIHPLSFPAVSLNASQEGLRIVSQNSQYSPKLKLSYSSLEPGESFLNYKIQEEVDASHLIPLNPGDSIKGEIMVDSRKWNFRYGPSSVQNSKGHPQSDGTGNPESRINPESSDVKVYYVDINSMEAPHSYPIDGISRKLVNDEVDDNMYIIIKSDFCFEAKIRVKILTTKRQEILSEPINITYIKPDQYENQPF